MYNEQGKKELIQRAVDELKRSDTSVSYSEVEELINMLNHNPSGEKVVTNFLKRDSDWLLSRGDIELILEVLAPIANEMLDYDYYEERDEVMEKPICEICGDPILKSDILEYQDGDPSLGYPSICSDCAEIGMVDKKEDKMSAMKENVDRIARQLRSRGEMKLAREVLALNKVAFVQVYEVSMTVNVLDTEEIDSEAILEEYIKNAVNSKIVEVKEISAF